MNSNTIIIPVSNDHLKQLELNSHFLKNLNPSKIIIIGSEIVKQKILGLGLDYDFINEDDLETKKKLRKVFEKKEINFKRFGWYLQQFIKMNYSFCTDKQYIVWDIDTIPLKEISFYQDGKYLFECKYL